MNCIYLAPIGTVDEDLLDMLEQSIWQAFGFDVRRAVPRGEAAYAFDAARLQYSSTLILRELVRAVPSNALRILGVTEVDLFIPMLSFIYGQAQLGGKGAIVSTARLGQEFYSMPRNQGLKSYRTTKEAIHELGHTFGLIHCLDKGCPMSLATTIQQLDAKGSEFCSGCSTVLRENVIAFQKTT